MYCVEGKYMTTIVQRVGDEMEFHCCTVLLHTSCV